MKSIMLWEIRGAEKLGTQPNERFTVTIQSEEERRDAAREPTRLTEAIGRGAQEAGLTPEVLGTDVKPLHLSTEPVESLWGSL